MIKRYLCFATVFFFLTALLLLLSSGRSFPEKAGKKPFLKSSSRLPGVHSKPAGLTLNEETSCKIPAKGRQGICRHCGCRMSVSPDEMEKRCTVCKCGKKTRECLLQKL